jgi:hypothetical protein
VFKGGALIEDYRVNIKEQGGTYSVLASAIANTHYTAIGLTAGTTYVFTVESRNSYGYSVVSEEITMLCAFIPEPPLTVATSNLGDQIVLDWIEPVTNGSPITAYRVYVRESDYATFTEESVECVGTEADVVTNRQCQISLATLQQ